MLEYFTAALSEGDTTSHGEYELRYDNEYTGSRGGRHVIEAHHPEDGKVARLEWMGLPPYAVHNITVEPEHRRRGLATAMWNWAQENARPKPRHSEQRTDSGDAWARSVGGRLPRRKARRSEAQVERSFPINPGYDDSASISDYFGGGHGGAAPDRRVAGRGKPRSRQRPGGQGGSGGAPAAPGGGAGGAPAGQQRGEADEGGGRLEGPRPVEFHPGAHKDLKALDRPVQKQIKGVIDALANGEQGLQTHALSEKLKGWYSTKASRGHRVVHRNTDDGGIHIGYVGLHDYDKAIRRLTKLTREPGPVSFPYLRNTEGAPNLGSMYGQDVEPHGRYLRYHDGPRPEGDRWETGTASFENPLHLDSGGNYGDPSNWKHQLSSQFGGKKGKALSRAVVRAGHDAIITHDEYGPDEIVDLTSFKKTSMRKDPIQVCPCGMDVVFDPQDGWQHADGSVSHDGEFYGRSVSDLMKTAVKPRPTGKLPQEEGLYWRLHRKGRPFSRQDATSQVFYKPDEPYESDFDDPDDYRAAHEMWTDLTSAKPGYSSYASPHHVEQYAQQRNLETGDSDVVAFHGKQVGYGNDDEPLVMPHHDKPFMRMPYREFQRRLRRTKKPWNDLELSEDDTGGYYDEDGLGGYFGMRRTAEIEPREASRNGDRFDVGRVGELWSGDHGMPLQDVFDQGVLDEDRLEDIRRNWSRIKHEPIELNGTPGHPAELADGHHRLQVAQEMGEKSLPAYYHYIPYDDEPDHRTASHPRPTSRVFGPTYGLDHRLFTGEKLKPEVRTAVLARLGPVIEPLLGEDWKRYTKVYLAGSEASEWTSETLEGNGDFDTLIGVDYDHLGGEPGIPVAGMDDQDITDALNKALREDYNASPWKAPFGGDWDLTGYVNAGSYDIRKIKPYAAYNITDDEWSVRPPHLPDWSIEKLPEGGDNLLAEAEGYAAVIEAISKMPEPFRTQQGKALWKHLHSDRGRAFSDEGEGWLDPGNLIEKALVEWGLWDKLVEWQYGKQKTAAKLPEGLTFEHRPPSRRYPDDHQLVVHHPDAPHGAFDNYVGHLTWSDHDGEISGAWIAQPWQRKGIGTELFRRAKEITPELHHAPEEERSDAGQAWINSLGSSQQPWVEHVRVDKLLPHREWQHQRGGFSYDMEGDGPYAGKHDAESWDANKRSVAEQGIQHPLTLEYNPTTHSAYLGEGNHRLHWAHELGHETVPVRMWRTSKDMPERYRIQGEPKLTKDEHGYFPQDGFKPSDVLPADYFPSRGKTAGAHGDLPEGLTFRHEETPYQHQITAETPDDGEIGYLFWSKDEQPAGGKDENCPTCDRYQWDEGHKHPAGEIEDIDVVPAHRRKGVGRAMLQHARSLPVEPKPVHSDVLTDEGRAWMEKNAGAQGDLPDLTFRHLPPEDNHSYGGADQDTHTLHAYTADGQHAGELSWFGEDGMIRDVGVHPDYRRRGIASELLHRARQIQPDVHHSDALTSDGAGWARKVSMLEYFAVKRSDHPLAPDLPQEQHDALDTENWSEHKRKMLDLAKNPVPGTHIWRGEVRAQEPVKSARETGVGIHWGVNPDTILRPQASDGEHEVVYHAEIEHPGEQNFSRSHSMWHGRHMSLDSEAEVRLKPGTRVKLHGVWYRDPYVSERGPFSPTKPERMGKQWSYTPINEYVEVAHRPTTDLIDYSDVGVKHEGMLGYFTAAETPELEMRTRKGKRKGVSHTTITAYSGDSKAGHVRMTEGDTEVDDLHVVPGMRGKGVAHALMNEAIDRFGHQPLRLHASPFGKGGLDRDALMGFYASHGFEPEEDRGSGYMVRHPRTSKTADYRLMHRAPNENSGKPLHEFEGGDPDDLVRIYRAAPHHVDYFDNDTWATTDPDYAHQHAEQYDGSKKWPVMSAEVPKKHVFWDENDPHEVGYQGPRLESHHIELHDQETGEHYPYEPPSQEEQKELDRGGNYYHGMGVHLSPEDHAFVHDESKPIAERAHRVFRHVPERIRQNGTPHWETDPEDAEMDTYDEDRHVGKGVHDTPLTRVVVHGSQNLEHAHGISWADDDDINRSAQFSDYHHHEFEGDPNERLNKQSSISDYFGMAA